MVRDNPNPFIQAIDADTWAEERNYRQQDGAQALNGFLRSRQNLLEIAQAFPPDTAEKTIQHTLFGPTTLQELIRIASRHDRLHIQQLFAQIPP